MRSSRTLRRSASRTWRCLLVCLSLGLAAAHAARAEPAPLAILVLLKDPPALGDTLARARGADLAETALAPRRAALLAARHASFVARQAALEAALGKQLRAVPGHRLEALPVLNAFLVYVPAAAGEIALDILRAAGQTGDVDFAYVAPQGHTPIPAPLADLSRPPLLHPEGCSNRPSRAAAPVPPNVALTLGIIDSGADAEHPWLASGLGRLFYRPGTPGAQGHRLLRSHGTAMLGIYAQQALGLPLRANGTPVAGAGDPKPYAATLIARAGPETPDGRSGLLRSLAWMMTPTATRPLPDLINYSQGNGPLCARPAGDCAHLPWFGVTRVLDRLIEELGIVVVKSAGNRGYRSGTSMTVPGDTYNGITVGNMHAFDWASCAASAERGRHKVYRTSSTAAPGGPRLLDLVAPGVRIETAGVDPAYCRARCMTSSGPECAFCARLGTAGSATAGFHKMNSGTSPAAAITGVVAGRLLQVGVQHPMAVKAVLINSADSWDSGGQAHPAVRGDGRGCATDTRARAHGPYPYGAHYDRSYGWGYLNPDRALAEHPGVLTAALAPASTHCYALTLAPWEKVTLVWQRRVVPCPGCGADGWARLSRLDLALYTDDPTPRLIDRDREHHPLDNVLQVSNGRGPGRTGQRQTVVRIGFATPWLDAAAAEPYALAAPRPPRRLAQCPNEGSPAGQP